MYGQLSLAILFFVLGTLYLLGFSLGNRVWKKLSYKHKRAYLYKNGLLYYLFAIFILCMVLLERYEVLTRGIYIFVYILGGCVLVMLGICLKRKYMKLF